MLSSIAVHHAIKLSSRRLLEIQCSQEIEIPTEYGMPALPSVARRLACGTVFPLQLSDIYVSSTFNPRFNESFLS